MLTSDSMRGYNDLLILATLQKGDSYGYAISKAIFQQVHEKYLIKETTLYSAFARLEKNQLIIAYPGKMTHGKPRTYYKISQEGQKYLEKKKEEWHEIQTIMNLFFEEEKE
ncbi:PadR family transcriptional regulator [Enterococcus timonensis]|uniref:PadR family transcriptional regulator n=1 Tax=Enterococcus timonensis TaxID=1852364 RepID=UPI0008D931F5|nr:PadR family transcriptional regulator [Enterococcus timonensis]